MAQRSGAVQAAANVIRGSADPDLFKTILTSRMLVLAPHMDDEMLACGGTMLLHAQKHSIHCVFATDGAASPAPLLPWAGHVDRGLPEMRRREALAAAAMIGVPAANLRFFGLPDGRLSAHRPELAAALDACLEEIRPAFVLVPFRYDVHPDHTTLNRAARALLSGMTNPPAMLEYFVYHRLRFVPGGDVRRAIDAAALLTVDILAVAQAKRDALDCYVSQTTVRYQWQDRPILTPESLQLRCSEAELFLPTDPAAPLSEDLASYGPRIRLACLAARYGKRPKDRVRALLNGITASGRQQ